MSEFSYKLGYVMASNYRKKVMVALHEKSMMPADLAKKTSIYPSHVSNTLKELSEKTLVVCTNPKSRKGRMYDLTKEGRKMLKEIL